MGNEIKQKWISRATQFVEESGAELTLVDKSTIRRAIDNFFQDYIDAQGREPIFDYSTVRVLYYSYLHPFGYVMPRVERWAREDIERLRDRIELPDY